LFRTLTVKNFFWNCKVPRWHEHFVIQQSEINRNDILEYKEKKINRRVPLVLTYYPSLEKISCIVRHHWKGIEKSETLAKLFPEPPVVLFRRPKSIKDALVRAAVSRRSASVNHVVTSVTSAVSNCNTHKCAIARRHERSIQFFAMSSCSATYVPMYFRWSREAWLKIGCDIVEKIRSGQSIIRSETYETMYLIKSR
jgi:hypothetical protein